MYTVMNYKTKKALKEALAAGVNVEVFQPGGIFPSKEEGSVALEGPHYPAPHTWYASCRIHNRFIIPGTLK